jgi:hypothetical protein
MAQNHLVIGLGGTGGKIIRALRKTMYLDQGSAQQSGDDHFRYLYVDTSREMMDQGDESWQVLGHSVQLDPASQLHIEDNAMHSVLADINSHPQIKAWIGDPKIMGSIPGDVAAGGQKRRVGRFKFARKAGDFMQRVTSLVSELQSETKQQSVKFHVFCGLAGGTGSGSVVDVVAMLRSAYPRAKQDMIVVYALLPEQHPQGNRNTGNYHANGYAALSELNALSAGAWKPHDLRTGEPIKLPPINEVPVFDGCYVFCDSNESGVKVDLDKDLPNIVADFVHQRNSVVDWDALNRAETGENGDNTPELDPLGKPSRAKRFLAFGIKRLVVPETEIREYLTYTIAQQSAWQQLYNTWSDNVGFVDTPKPRDLHAEVNDASRHNDWMITDHHLTQSEAILEDDKKRNWRRIDDDWMAVMDRFANDVKTQKSKVTERIVPLRTLCEKRFSEDFRQHGVAGFYELKGKARGDLARAVRQRIELDLFSSWENGQRSLMELGEIARLLRAHLEARLQKVPEHLERHRGEVDTYRNKVEALTKEINSLGFITFSKDEKLWGQLVDNLKHQYIHRTHGEAWKFAQTFLQQIIMEVDDLIGQIQRMTGCMTQAVQLFSNEVASRCRREEAGQDKDRYTTRIYDPQQVADVARKLVSDEQTAKARQQNLRKALIGQLGSAPNFAMFNDRLTVDRLRNVMAERCDAEAQDAHQTYVAQTNQRVMGVNIVERLHERFAADPQGLKKFAQEASASASAYVQWAESEAQRRGEGIPVVSPTRVSTFGVMLPECDAMKDFRKSLSNAFAGAHSGADIIAEGARVNEITIFHVKNLFPLRFLSHVEFLRGEYIRRMASASEVDRLVLHLEGDGSHLPSLYAPSTEDIKRKGLKFLFMASALGMVTEEPHGTTGKLRIVFNTEDADGFPEQIELGADFVASYEQMAATQMTGMQKVVEKALGERANQHEDQRKVLRDTIVGMTKNLLAKQFNGDQQNTAYQLFLAEAREALGLLK